MIIRYSPVRHCTPDPKVCFPFDLHVSTTPPAFVLSQDQTLQLNKKSLKLKTVSEANPMWSGIMILMFLHEIVDRTSVAESNPGRI